LIGARSRTTHILKPLLVILPLALGFSSAAGGQWQLLPGGEVPKLLVPPREPHLGLRVIAVLKGATAFGSGFEWEANFGHMVPFIRFSGDGAERSVTLAVQGGAFGRFSLETKKRDLISSDWVFAAPLYITTGPNWVRFRYRHISSHIGDDYIVRFDETPQGYLRDDLGVMVYRRVSPGTAMYGGFSYAFNVDPVRIKRAIVEAGVEFNAQSASGTPWYGGVDVWLDQDAKWRPRVNVHAGTWLTEQGDHRLRFTIEFLTGRSPQGEFRRWRATYFATGLKVEI
jgi:hypothetical protein